MVPYSHHWIVNMFVSAVGQAPQVLRVPQVVPYSGWPQVAHVHPQREVAVQLWGVWQGLQQAHQPQESHDATFRWAHTNTSDRPVDLCRQQPWHSGSELDCRWTRRAIDPAPGSWSIPEVISLAQVFLDLTVQIRGLQHQYVFADHSVNYLFDLCEHWPFIANYPDKNVFCEPQHVFGDNFQRVIAQI